MNFIKKLKKKMVLLMAGMILAGGLMASQGIRVAAHTDACYEKDKSYGPVICYNSFTGTFHPVTFPYWGRNITESCETVVYCYKQLITCNECKHNEWHYWSIEIHTHPECNK